MFNNLLVYSIFFVYSTILYKYQPIKLLWFIFKFTVIFTVIYIQTLNFSIIFTVISKNKEFQKLTLISSCSNPLNSPVKHFYFNQNLIKHQNLIIFYLLNFNFLLICDLFNINTQTNFDKFKKLYLLATLDEF